MLENISKLGSLLSKDQQKAIQGGDAFCQGGCAGKNQGGFESITGTEVLKMGSAFSVLSSELYYEIFMKVKKRLYGTEN